MKCKMIVLATFIAMITTTHAARVLHYWDFEGQTPVEKAQDKVGQMDGIVYGDPGLEPILSQYGPGETKPVSCTLNITGVDPSTYSKLNGFVEMPDRSGLDFGQNSFSFSLWFYDDPADGDDRLFRAFDFVAGYKSGIQTMSWGEQGLNFTICDHYENIGGTPKFHIEPNQWHHVVITVDRDNEVVKSYCDGEFKGGNSISQLTGDIYASRNLTVGLVNMTYADNALNSYAGRPWQWGSIDDLAFYEGVLSQDDITSLASGTILPSAITGNKAPVADAGADQTVHAFVDGYAMVQLDGMESYDEDGDALEYFWFLGGEQIATGAQPTVMLEPGEYVIDLVVNDGSEDSEPDSCVVTVIESIETTAKLTPQVLNRRTHRPHVIGRLDLHGLSVEELDPNTPMLLMPGEIEAMRVDILPAGDESGPRVLTGFFDNAALMEAIETDGNVDVTIAVRLLNGQWVYGTDTVRVLDTGRTGPTPPADDTETEQGGSTSEPASAFPVIYSYSSAQTGNGPEKILDGDTGDLSRWSAKPMPQWVIIDYGAEKNICGTRLWSFENRAYQYIVEASNAPSSGYTTLVDRRGNADNTQPISDDFAAVSARYVKITVTGAVGYTGNWAALTEFEIIEALPDNHPPIADARADQTVHAFVDGYAMVPLDGTASTDEDGDALEYFWFLDGTQIATRPEPSVILEPGEYVIDLIVNDGTEDSEPDSCVVTVIEAIEMEAMLTPQTLNRLTHRPHVIGRLELAGLKRGDIDPDAPMLLMPGDIEAGRVQVLPARSGAETITLMGFFDNAMLMEAIAEDGDMEVTIAARLLSGQWVYGTDTVKVIHTDEPAPILPDRIDSRFLQQEPLMHPELQAAPLTPETIPLRR